MAAITDKPILKPVNLQLANYVINSETGIVQEYKHLIKGPDKDIWMTLFANELVCLYQGVGDRLPTGTETFFSSAGHWYLLTNSHVWLIYRRNIT